MISITLHGFTHYIVCDEDGNVLSRPDVAHNPLRPSDSEVCDSPDDAYKLATYYVREVWRDFEVATIYGVVEARRKIDDSTTEAATRPIPVLRVMRSGPPGSLDLRVEHADFRWLAWDVRTA